MADHSDIDDDLVATSSQGQQVIDLPPIRISLLSELSYVSKLDIRVFNDYQYIIAFPQNKVLRSLMVFGSSKRDHLEPFLETLRPFDVESEGQVVEVLRQLFPDLDISFLRKRSRTPARIGAIVKSKDAYILFSFRIFRGAIKSALLTAELQQTLRIEAL